MTTTTESINQYNILQYILKNKNCLPDAEWEWAGGGGGGWPNIIIIAGWGGGGGGDEKRAPRPRDGKVAVPYRDASAEGGVKGGARRPSLKNRIFDIKTKLVF